MKNCVYVLSCKDGRYYIGHAADLDVRIEQHYRGKVRATEKRRPLKLVFSQEYKTSNEAHRIELWIKKQKSRKLIDQIIQDHEIKKSPNVSP